MRKPTGEQRSRSELLREVTRKRGYQLPFHALLAQRDPQFLEAYEGLVDSSYAASRCLSRKEKELLYVAVLSALNGDPDHIAAHIKAAADAGATREQIFEVLELIMIPAGVTRFMNACAAWRQAFPDEALASEYTLEQP